jgi:hypothetical protein
MAWTKQVVNNNGDLLLTEDVSGGSADAKITFTSELNDFLKGLDASGHRYISVFCVADQVTGTNFDVALYGDASSSATTESKATAYSLVDAIVADITDTVGKGGVVDVALYPARYRHIGFLCDTGDVSADTITVYVFIPAV